MEQQEIHDELSQTGAQELLASSQPARPAYIAKDGTPRVIPTGMPTSGSRLLQRGGGRQREDLPPTFLVTGRARCQPRV